MGVTARLMTRLLERRAYHVFYYLLGVTLALLLAASHLLGYAVARRFLVRRSSSRALLVLRVYVTIVMTLSAFTWVMFGVSFERIPRFLGIFLGLFYLMLGAWFAMALIFKPKVLSPLPLQLHTLAVAPTVSPGAISFVASSSDSEDADLLSLDMESAKLKPGVYPGQSGAMPLRLRVLRRYVRTRARASAMNRAVVSVIERHRVGAAVAVITGLVVTCITVAAMRDMCVEIEPIAVTTAMTRRWLPHPCPGPQPCHVYLTVPEDLRSGMIVNFHVADSMHDYRGGRARVHAMDQYDDLDGVHRSGWVVYDTQAHDDPNDYRYARPAIAVTGHDWTLKYEVPRTVWYAPLADLAGNTTYHFRAGTVVDRPGTHRPRMDSAYCSKDNHFVTAPTGQDAEITLVAGGDVGVMDRVIGQHQLAASQDPLAALIGGDLAYANGFRECYRRWDTFFNLWETYMRAPGGRMIPMLFAVGNHEAGGLKKDAEDVPFYLAYFPQSLDAAATPAQRPSYHQHVIADDAVVLALDTAQISLHEGVQATWLEQQLEQSQGHTAWQIPLYHIPLFPGTWSHHTDDYMQVARESWQALFDKYHVPLALENHGHYYKRTHRLVGDRVAEEDELGTVYLGDGAYGVDPQQAQPQPEYRWYLAKHGAVNNIIRLDIQGVDMLVSVLTPDGAVYDSLDLRAPGAPAHQRPN